MNVGEVVHGFYFVGVKGVWGLEKEQCFLVRVYGLHEIQKKGSMGRDHTSKATKKG